MLLEGALGFKLKVDSNGCSKETETVLVSSDSIRAVPEDIIAVTVERDSMGCKAPTTVPGAVTGTVKSDSTRVVPEEIVVVIVATEKDSSKREPPVTLVVSTAAETSVLKEFWFRSQGMVTVASESFVVAGNTSKIL